jgi:tRNA nucleotidyltransferase (CCA-adding enzyme)
METYLVGGAVRDDLLGLDVRERDFVVVGATEAEMRNAGYRSVGKDFPVFLHPDTSEEYALARTERKIAPGHQGFECHASPDVTLEEDLLRRDLTINAIAKDDEGNLIDPYGGQADLEAKTLRHVSNAFSEDPLRVLRVARFKASLHHLGFTVSDDTFALMKSMALEGQIEELSVERVLAEMNKALGTPNPAEFFVCLEALGAHEILWPEIAATEIRQLAKSDPEDPESRFAQLLMHNTVEEIRTLCARLKCPNRRTELTLMINQQLDTWRRFPELTPEEKVEFVLRNDGLRKTERFEQFSTCAEQISGENQTANWQAVVNTMASVKARDLDTTESGSRLGELVREEQLRRVALS